jgi:hypothetical protein
MREFHADRANFSRIRALGVGGLGEFAGVLAVFGVGIGIAKINPEPG